MLREARGFVPGCLSDPKAYQSLVPGLLRRHCHAHVATLEILATALLQPRALHLSEACTEAAPFPSQLQSRPGSIQLAA